MTKTLLTIAALLCFASVARAEMPVTTMAPVETPAAATPAADAPVSSMPLAPGAVAAMPATQTDRPADDLLNKYYARCMSEIYTDLSSDAREEFCACSAAQMKDTMTAGEMITLDGAPGGAAVDTVKLATNVVAPCFAPVAQELEYNSCEAASSYVHMYRTREAFDATCRCVGGRAGDYVQTYGRDLMAYVLALNPHKANDPASALRRSPEYRNEVGKAQEACMNKYVYK